MHGDQIAERFRVAVGSRDGGFAAVDASFDLDCRNQTLSALFLTQTLYRDSMTTIGSGNSHTATGVAPVRGSAATSIAQ